MSRDLNENEKEKQKNNEVKNENMNIDSEEYQQEFDISNSHEDKYEEQRDDNNPLDDILDLVANKDTNVEPLEDNKISAVALTEDRFFYSLNLLLKDSHKTIDNESFIRQQRIGYSERRYESLLDRNDIILEGAFSLTYYQIFSSILSNSIYQESVRIGVLLKNKQVMRDILYKLLDSVPQRFNRRNQGYLRKNMMISKSHLHLTLKEILDKTIERGRRPSRDIFIAGLTAIVEITVLAQLVNFDLIDVSELSRSNLVHMSNAQADLDSFDTIKSLLLASRIHKLIGRIIGSTSSLSKILNSETENKSVDFETIIANTTDELDRLADSLISFELMSQDLDSLLCIARVYRDRDVFSDIQDFISFTNECRNFVESNIEIFKYILVNREFNLYMDKLTMSAIKYKMSQIHGALSVIGPRLVEILNNMSLAFSAEDSLIKIYKKEEFLDKFSINILTDSDGRTYSVLGHKNFSRNGEMETFEALGFKNQPSRDLINIRSGLGLDSLMLINHKHRSRPEFNRLVDTASKIATLAVEQSLDYNRINLLPSFQDHVVHQYALIEKHDLKKIACCLSDVVLVPYLSYSRELLENAKSSDKQLINLMEKNKTSLLTFYSVRAAKSVSHPDIIQDRDLVNKIITANPCRIIEQTHSWTGKTNIQVITERLKPGNNFMSREYANTYLERDITFWPDNRRFRLKLIDDFNKDTNMYLTLNMDEIVDPISRFNSIFSARDRYLQISDAYNLALTYFLVHNIGLSQGTYVNNEFIENNIVLEDTSIISDLQNNWRQSFALGSKRNVVNWHDFTGFTLSAFNDKSIQLALRAYERGVPMPIIEGKNTVSIDLKLKRLVETRTLLKEIQDLMIKRKFGSMLSSVSYHFNNYCYGFYMNDVFFKSIVDSSLNDTLGMRLDRLSDLDSVIELFSRTTGVDLPKYTHTRAASAIILFIYAMSSKGGDLRKHLSNTEKTGQVVDEMFKKTAIGIILQEEKNVQFSEFASQRFVQRINELKPVDPQASVGFFRTTLKEDKDFRDITSSYFGAKLEQ